MNEEQKEAIVKLAELVETMATYMYPVLGETRYQEVVSTVKEVRSTMRE